MASSILGLKNYTENDAPAYINSEIALSKRFELAMAK